MTNESPDLLAIRLFEAAGPATVRAMGGDDQIVTSWVRNGVRYRYAVPVTNRWVANDVFVAAKAALARGYVVEVEQAQYAKGRPRQVLARARPGDFSQGGHVVTDDGIIEMYIVRVEVREAS